MTGDIGDSMIVRFEGKSRVKGNTEKFNRCRSRDNLTVISSPWSYSGIMSVYSSIPWSYSGVMFVYSSIPWSYSGVMFVYSSIPWSYSGVMFW